MYTKPVYYENTSNNYDKIAKNAYNTVRIKQNTLETRNVKYALANFFLGVLRVFDATTRY